MEHLKKKFKLSNEKAKKLKEMKKENTKTAKIWGIEGSDERFAEIHRTPQHYKNVDGEYVDIDVNFEEHENDYLLLNNEMTVGFRKDKKTKKFLGLRDGNDKQFNISLDSLRINSNNITFEEFKNIKVDNKNKKDLIAEVTHELTDDILLKHILTDKKYQTLIKYDKAIFNFKAVFKIELAEYKILNKFNHKALTYEPTEEEYSFVFRPGDDSSEIVLAAPIAYSNDMSKRFGIKHRLWENENGEIFYEKYFEFVPEYMDDNIGLWVDALAYFHILSTINTGLYTSGGNHQYPDLLRVSEGFGVKPHLIYDSYDVWERVLRYHSGLTGGEFDNWVGQTWYQNQSVDPYVPAAYEFDPITHEAYQGEGISDHPDGYNRNNAMTLGVDCYEGYDAGSNSVIAFRLARLHLEFDTSFLNGKQNLQILEASVRIASEGHNVSQPNCTHIWKVICTADPRTWTTGNPSASFDDYVLRFPWQWGGNYNWYFRETWPGPQDAVQIPPDHGPIIFDFGAHSTYGPRVFNYINRTGITKFLVREYYHDYLQTEVNHDKIYDYYKGVLTASEAYHKSIYNGKKLLVASSSHENHSLRPAMFITYKYSSMNPVAPSVDIQDCPATIEAYVEGFNFKLVSNGNWEVNSPNNDPHAVDVNCVKAIKTHSTGGDAYHGNATSGLVLYADTDKFTSWYSIYCISRMGNIEIRQNDSRVSCIKNITQYAKRGIKNNVTPTISFASSGGSKEQFLEMPGMYNRTPTFTWVGGTPSWCIVSYYRYPNNQDMKLTFNCLSGSTAQSATFKITDDYRTQYITITRAAPVASLSVFPTTLFFTSETISKILNITCSGSWHLTDDVSWLSYSKTSGTGNATITVTKVLMKAISKIIPIPDPNGSGKITVSSGSLVKTVTVIYDDRM